MSSGPFSVSAPAHSELYSPRTGEKYSMSAVLTDLIGLKGVFVHHDIIPPGRSASGAHSHSHREEMLFVLEGTVIAHLRGESYQLGAGDFMGFPPGAENAHFVRNDSDAPARILVIASNPPGDEEIYTS